LRLWDKQIEVPNPQTAYGIKGKNRVNPAVDFRLYIHPTSKNPARTIKSQFIWISVLLKLSRSRLQRQHSPQK
ncbi:MAG: hypothetical protein M0Z75_09870, partial [Nitrospiraceae bacterium]|nr:hypothetical protein [Nitrospiraceae bacterium]